MVPRLSISSCRSMPMPLSATTSVLSFLFVAIEIFGGSPSAISSGLAIASYRSLSQASDAFEISSRRKMSVSEYTECTIRCSSSETSAWKGWDSAEVSVVFIMGLGLVGKRRLRESPDIAIRSWMARFAGRVAENPKRSARLFPSE